MDEKTREEIQRAIKRQQYIKASAESKIIKLQSQLETGETRISRNKPKSAKGTKDDIKVTKSDKKVHESDAKATEKGFFETIFS